MKSDGRAILLVEDNADDEALTLRAFEKNNIKNQVIVARDGAEALDVLFGRKAEPVKPQVILLDLKLPKIDGLSVLKKIRESPITHSLPVVILTSSREDQDLITGYDFGANSYVRKPVSFTEFIEAVRQLGLYWLILNETPPSKE